jgi:hypothetical protein
MRREAATLDAVTLDYQQPEMAFAAKTAPPAIFRIANSARRTT